MAAKEEVVEHVPAILSHVESDLVSLAICGYIGGRCMHLKYPGPVFPSTEWVAWGLAGAMLTAFGGGSMYVLLMKRSGDRRFGWQDPLAVSAALLGFLLSTYFVPHCGRAIEDLLGIGCGTVFNFLDCVNNAILIAWGTSKSLLDAQGMCRSWMRFMYCVVATYTYSFGGGIARDVIARCLLGPPAGAVGNLSAAVALPAILAIAFYQCLLKYRGSGSELLQLGLGIPVLVGLFHGAGLVLAV
ncbi:unnamed protein product [Symbiodinium sp. CCMP2456]|nr:unnamed protein product [Symbiodinium sp. CCMP2456]